jgi:hypothetical protein
MLEVVNHFPSAKTSGEERSLGEQKSENLGQRSQDINPQPVLYPSKFIPRPPVPSDTDAGVIDWGIND